MRIKIGGIKDNGNTFLGIRCFVCYLQNPLDQLLRALKHFFSYRSLGLVVFITVPCARFTIVKKRKEVKQ